MTNGLCLPRLETNSIMKILLVLLGAAAALQAADLGSVPLRDGWKVRTGVLPKFEAKATFDAQGVLTIEGGGEANRVVRLLPAPANQPKFTSAFVYRAFSGDFIITGRRTRMEKGTGHENAGSGVAAIGGLDGYSSGVALASAGCDGGTNANVVWFRIIRRGDRVGVYEGPDGKQWMASQSGAVITGPTVNAGFYTSSWGDEGSSRSIFDSISVVEKPVFTYSTTWLANEFEGGWDNTVNSNMISLVVDPDGTCYTGGMYGEQEACLGRYKDGQVTTLRPAQRVGDPGVMAAVPGGSEVLYTWENTIGIFERTGLGRGKGSERIGTSIGHDSLRGLAVAGDEIFVSSRPDNMIYVLDLKERKVQRKLPFTRPGPLAVDAKGVLWAVEEGWTRGHPCLAIYEKPFRLLGLDSKTGKQVAEITGVGLPSALCADTNGPSKARLLVADNGPDQQVKIFDVSGKQPKLAGTLGTKGGVYAGTPGQMREGKFFGITGVGSDATGNIYTTTNGYPFRVAIPHSMPAISQLKAFGQSEIGKPEPKALWSLHCTAFNIMGSSYDPATGDVYVGGLARYAFDAKRGLGREWQLDGLTSNPRDDVPSETMWRTFQSSPDIRRIDGQRFLFLSGCASGGYNSFRLDAHGNLGVPVQSVSASPNRLKDAAEQRAKDPDERAVPPAEDPPTPTFEKKRQMDWAAYDWADGRGGKPIDARPQLAEYRDLSSAVTDAGDGMSWQIWLDAKGGAWFCNPLRPTVCYRRCTGVQAGVPQYDGEVKVFPLPAPFTSVHFMDYDPERDVMVLSGQTAENRGGWLIDAVAVRYTNWSTKPVAGDQILYMPPFAGDIASGEGDWRRPHMIDKPVAWAVAGDVLYATNRTGTVRAYDLLKGNLIEWMDPGPEVLGTGGFFEGIHSGVRAFDVGKGEHLILRQSNNTIRILAHRLKPAACSDGTLPLAPEPWARCSAGAADLQWGGRTYRTGTIKGYKVYRAERKEGPYKPLGGLIEQPSLRDPLPNGTSAWYRVATVNLVGEGPQSEPVQAASAKPSVTLKPDIDVSTRGNWQNVYGKLGAYLARDQLKGGDEKQRRYGLDPTVRVEWPGIAMYSKDVEASTDADLLQSVFGEGRRTGDGGWYEGRIVLTVLDGKPRRLTVAVEARRKQRLIFRDPETGTVMLDHAVPQSDQHPKTIYLGFTMAGRVEIELKGEPFLAFYIDRAQP